MIKLQITVKLLTAAVLFLVVRSTYAFDNNQVSANGLAGVIGYLTAQKATLELIKETYPELKRDVQTAELEFEVRFPGFYMPSPTTRNLYKNWQ